MPVTADKPAPYTSPSVIVDILQRHRSKGLPQPVNNEVLARAGVSESLIPRTLQALYALDLIDDQGKITPIFEGIRLAPEAEYQKRLAEWLHSAYADVLQYIDPATADEIEIRDAFRLYNPTGQQSRMVTLFMGLYAAAGVSAPKPAGKASSAPRPNLQQRRKPLAKKPDIKKPNAAPEFAPSTGLNPALSGLLKSLPANGHGWTQEQRNKFYETFGAVLDFCIPIGPQNAFATEEDAEEDVD